MKRRLLCLALCLLMATGLFETTAMASPDWPSDVNIESDAGIIMDANTGAVLYGKNAHTTFSPASITKVLTALIILENCSMDDMVTFSRNAVYNVESNSTSAGYDTGDRATVKDLMYAILLKSANEAANALAEHLSGTTEEFAVLMNEKAAELGCIDSNFTNPSGLNDENHYVSAYDMALITRAAFNNEVFSEIVATTYYELPPNSTSPEGQGISPGNRMVKPNWPDQYRPDVIGGKTGFTSIALNTLVVCAEQNDTKLVTVILHSNSTHYEDTKRMLDYGFKNFHSVRIADYDNTYSSIGDDLKISGLPTSDKPVLTIDPGSRITLPKTTDFSEASAVLNYTLPADAPEEAIASISYTLGERAIGQAYLTLSDPFVEAGASVPPALLEVKPSTIAPARSEAEDESAAGVSGAAQDAKGRSTEPTEPKEPEDSKFKISLKVPSVFWKLLMGVLVITALVGGGSIYFIRYQKNEAAERLRRRQRRAERLKETGISEGEFDLMMQDRRISGPVKDMPKKKKRRP